jgi:hypothetical protein
VSDQLSTAEQRLGYLLLRDGHAVPLRGISPEDIKAGAKHRVPNPDAEPLRHKQCLNAIVDRLGFRGDFGTFQNEGWLHFQSFLNRNRCTHRVGVFPVDHGGCIDLYFSNLGGPAPRQLADRIFEARDPKPERVFLGYGVNWPVWDCGNGIDVPAEAIASISSDVGTAPQRASHLFARRHDLLGQWGFLDDKLVCGPMRTIIDKSYWPLGCDTDEHKQSLASVAVAVNAFRGVFDHQPEGWVDVLAYNDRLVILRACDGGWDLLWRNYREKEPPKPALVSAAVQLDVEDIPSRLMTESNRRRAIHFRQGVWEEREAHEAEQAFYDRGGSAVERRTTSDADVLFKWLREQGKLPAPERMRWEGTLPRGFRIVVLDGRKVALSEMIRVGSFRQMLLETGYGERRHDCDEKWDRANGGAYDEAPVGASWVDAQAFCAWTERQIGVALRLPTRKELRLLRPAFSAHYERLADRDFPWEHFPPRPIADHNTLEPVGEVPSAVAWSEPRFDEPRAGSPRFPSASGLTNTSRKRWIRDFPPSATWRSPMPLVEHNGLNFIDAWDAYEWCQERGWISGRFWEGSIGSNSWGACKNVKVTFRLVLDLEE